MPTDEAEQQQTTGDATTIDTLTNGYTCVRGLNKYKDFFF